MHMLLGGVVVVAIVVCAYALISNWERFPEVVQWALLLPTLAFGMCAVGIVFLAIRSWQGEEGFWAEISQALVMASTWPALVFALAPRAKARVGWVAYGITMTGVGLVLVLFIVKGLAAAGAFVLAPELAAWDRRDSIELAQTLIWLIVVSASFFRQLPDAQLADDRAAEERRQITLQGDGRSP